MRPTGIDQLRRIDAAQFPIFIHSIWPGVAEAIQSGLQGGIEYVRMRIISGKYRSRPLRALAGLDVRPTSDRLRETLFNVLAAGAPGALDGTAWLDLYAGTGAVGIEALSRGAGSVTFVEKTKQAARAIRENLKSLEIHDGADVIEQDALKALPQLDGSYDYCFFDPPYRMKGQYEGVLRALSDLNVMKAGGVVIAEHDKRFDPGDGVRAVRRYRTLMQGDAGLSFYRVEEESK
jgi:16S rRNA (guanine966-N2)-methyltransferase